MKTSYTKLTFALFLGLMLSSALPKTLPAQAALTVYTLKGPSGVGLIRLFEEPPQAAGMRITVEALAQADLMAAKFIAGEAQVGVLPPNVAAKIAASQGLAASGRHIQIAAVLGNGMLSLLSADSGVTRLEDLRGKTVEVAGQGATPDYVFRRILLAHGLKADRDLHLSYSLAYPEIAQSLIAGRISSAVLPEPFATMALSGRPDLRVVGDIQAEWVRAGGQANFPMTVLVVDAEFAQSRPEALRAILDACRDSSRWVIAHPAEAGALVEKYDLGLRAPVVQAAVPRSNYVFIPAREARPALEALFRVFLEYEPASIGGTLPADGFYLP
jgi:NitT/TauT family transport system substrate-binding protein